MSRNIVALSWFNFFIDFTFYSPVAVLYFAAVTGSYALGMSIFSVAWIASAVFEVPTGVFSDMIGRKNTVIAGAVSSLFSVILYAMGGNYWWLFAGAVLEGLGRSFYSGNNDALLHDSLTESGEKDQYHAYYSSLNVYNQVGLFMVAILGGIIASISYGWVMWLSVIPRIILVGIALILIEPAIQSKKSSNVYAHLKESLILFRTNRKIMLLTIITAIRTSIYEGAFQFRTAFIATLWPLWAVGIAKAISNAGAAVSFRYSRQMLDKFGYKRVLVFEVIINRVINLGSLVFPTVLSPVFLGATSLLYGVTSTAVNTLQQKEFSQHQRATLGSLSSLFGSFAFSVVVVILGAISDRYGPANALILAHIFVLSILFFYHLLFSPEANA